MGRLSDFLEKRGIEKKQIPGALFYFKTLGYATWMGTFVLCYRYQPLRTFFAREGPKKWLDGFRGKYQVQYDWCQTKVETMADRMAKSKYFRPIPESLGLKSKRVTTSLMENIVFYKILTPVLLPAQFWWVMRRYSHKPEQVSLREVVSEVDQRAIDEHVQEEA